MFQHAPNKQKYAKPSINIVCHGNSITYGSGLSSPSTQSWPGLISALWPLAGGASVTVTNLGHPSWSWEKLNGQNGGYTTDVDGDYSVGKVNILLAGENTNSIYNGDSYNTIISTIKSYCSARLATHPWHLVLQTALPFTESSTNQTTVNSYNLLNDEVNTYLLSNYRALGAKMCIDWRPAGSPFSMSNYTLSNFISPLYQSDGTHPTAQGHKVLAAQIAQQLARLGA